MYTLAALFLVLAPLDTLSVQVGGGRVYASWPICGLLDALFIVFILSSRWRLPGDQIKPLSPFILFLVVGGYSLLVSPYFGAAAGKGAIQIVGIAGMLALVLCVSRICDGRLSLLGGLTKSLVVTLGVIGFIGFVQFAVNNMFRTNLVSFAALMRFSAQYIENGSKIGGIFRGNGIIEEPAHLTTYLTAGAGPALIRLGLLGNRARQRLAKYVPAWAALGIVAGYVGALSLVGYGAFIAVIAATLVFAVLPGRRRGLSRRTLGYFIGGIVAAGVVVGVSLWLNPRLTDKLATVSVVYAALNPAMGGIDKVSGPEISSLAVATNAVVAVRNLESHPLVGVGFGAHPVSFAEKMPAFATLFPKLELLNRDDAASLLLRLLSETGIMGTMLFLIGCLTVLAQGWAAVRNCRLESSGDAETERLFLLAIGLSGSCAAVMIAYLARFGAYFGAPLWGSIALVASLRPFAQKMRARVGASQSAPGLPASMGSVPVGST